MNLGKSNESINLCICFPLTESGYPSGGRSLFLYLIPGLSLADYLNCPCKVVKVTDGDTVNVPDQTKTLHKVRLQGIDAPERKQDFGMKSTQNLAKYVAGQKVKVEYNKRDN